MIARTIIKQIRSQGAKTIKWFPEGEVQKVLSQWMIEKIKGLYFNDSVSIFNVPGVKQNFPRLLILTDLRFSHRWGTNNSLTRVSGR